MDRRKKGRGRDIRGKEPRKIERREEIRGIKGREKRVWAFGI